MSGGPALVPRGMRLALDPARSQGGRNEDHPMSNAAGADAAYASRAGRQRTLWGGAFGRFIEWHD